METQKSKVDSLSNFGYEGYVRITYNNRGKKHSVKLHNMGTEFLGNLISIAIVGDPNNIDTIVNRSPSFLTFEAVINKGKDNEQTKPLLTTKVPITSKVWGPSVNDFDNIAQNNKNIIGKSQLSALISCNYIIRGQTLSNSVVPRLKLINNLGQDLAYLYDDNTSNKQLPLLYNALQNNQDALIDWIMYIMNVEGNTGGNK